MSRPAPGTIAALLGTALFMGVGTLDAQVIPGRVLEDLTSRPLATVSIMLLDSTDTAIDWAESDSLGSFVLEGRGAGPYRVFADRLGYGEVLSEPFSLTDLAEAQLELRMVAQPVELEGLLVTTEGRVVKLEREGFYRRRERASAGYFLDAEEIANIRPTLATTLLRRLPGVVVHRSPWGDVALSPRHYKPCPMKIVLDGYKLDLATSALDDWVDPESIIGVEVYPNRGTGAPVQHRATDAFCGIIMIWTR